jgi:hypothetical protein
MLPRIDKANASAVATQSVHLHIRVTNRTIAVVYEVNLAQRAALVPAVLVVYLLKYNPRLWSASIPSHALIANRKNALASEDHLPRKIRDFRGGIDWFAPALISKRPGIAPGPSQSHRLKRELRSPFRRHPASGASTLSSSAVRPPSPRW